MNQFVAQARRRAAAITGSTIPGDVDTRHMTYLERSCLRKKGFQTFDEADRFAGQEPYFCTYCGLWHRRTVK